MDFCKFVVMTWLLGIKPKCHASESRGLRTMYATTNVTRVRFAHYTRRNRHALASVWKAARRARKCRAQLNTLVDPRLGLLERLPTKQSGRQPVVLNFGSLSCPPFRCELDEFTKLAARFGNSALFVCVYIAEAHPTDGWYIGDKDAPVATHRTLADRQECADAMRSIVGNIHVICDTMDDAFAKYFGVTYGRLVVLHYDMVAYMGGHGPQAYDMDDMAAFLETIVGDHPCPRPKK